MAAGASALPVGLAGRCWLLSLVSGIGKAGQVLPVFLALLHWALSIAWAQTWLLAVALPGPSGEQAMFPLCQDPSPWGPAAPAGAGSGAVQTASVQEQPLLKQNNLQKYS